MSWCEGMCECGETVSYGFYPSEHEDELTEINITVLCGQCVRERDGIPSVAEIDEETWAVYEDFKNMVFENGMKNSIMWSMVDEDIHEILIMTSDFFSKYKDETYIKAAYKMLGPNVKAAIQW